MSKELEALKYFYTVSQNGNHPELVEDAYRILKDHLTPPTADEMCKQLSEAYGSRVYYNNVLDIWYYGEFSVTLDGILDMKRYDLITLIGRFYEGLEKVGNE